MNARFIIPLAYLSFYTLSEALEISSADDLQKAFAECHSADGDYTKIIKAAEELPSSEASLLYKKVNSSWSRQRDTWIGDFQKLAQGNSGQSRENSGRIKDLRNELKKMKNLGDDPMKAALKKRGMPALQELKKLLLPEVKDILASADKEVKKKRRGVTAFAKLRDALGEASIQPETQSAFAELQEAEKQVAKEVSGLDRKGLKIMEKNRKTAERKEVPEAERLGVEEANTMRLLLGYSALEIDPKLCAACRDHSKDMSTLKFFAHKSPVKGKENPSDRAKNFGTKGNGENIFAGSPNPEAANKGWFYSPGHHRNMFNPRWRYIGMGNHSRHWTQMFF